MWSGSAAREINSNRGQARVVAQVRSPHIHHFHHLIPLGPGAPALAREAIAQIEDLSNSTARSQAQLLVFDVLSHRVRASPAPCVEPIVLEILITALHLRVELIDGGAGPKPEPLSPRAPALDWDLQLVAQLAGSWGVRRDVENALWFELDIA